MMGDVLGEWKNRVVLPTYKKDDKKRWRNIEEFAYLIHIINDIVKF
jgi:hypothetical protein